MVPLQSANQSVLALDPMHFFVPAVVRANLSAGGTTISAMLSWIRLRTRFATLASSTFPSRVMSLFYAFAYLHVRRRLLPPLRRGSWKLILPQLNSPTTTMRSTVACQFLCRGFVN